MAARKPAMLLIAPAFYGYEAKIAKAFGKLGFSVDLRRTLPWGFGQTMKKLLPGAWRAAMERHCDRILEAWDGKRLDFALAVRGEPMPPRFFAELRSRHPEARTALYEWDSLSRVGYLPLTGHFDAVLSFEIDDCRARGYHYLPLFHVDEFAAAGGGGRDIDIACIGGYHPARDRIFRELADQARVAGLKCRVFEYMPFPLYAYLALFKGRKVRNRVSFSRIGIGECAAVIGRSKAVVDVEQDGQRGLTMRSFEALAAGAKLITTNAGIQDAPFYSPEYVALIDRERPVLDAAFTGSPGELPDMRPYSIDAWASAILAAAGFPPPGGGEA